MPANAILRHTSTVDFVSEAIQNRRWLWWLAGTVVSALLLLVVLRLVDWQQLPQLWTAAHLPLLLSAVALLTLEGMVIARRLQVCAGTQAPLRNAMLANAWYVLLINLMPARLGELAAIPIVGRELGQSLGAATASLVTQRLFDLAILLPMALVLLLVTWNTSSQNSETSMWWAVLGTCIALSLTLSVLLRIEVLLSVTAQLLRPGAGTGALRKRLLRVVLQARIWYRHHFPREHVRRVIGLTIVKWIINLAALAMLLLALAELSTSAAVTVAAWFNFVAVIPVPTIGGIGLGEAGLAGLLTMTSLPASAAAGVALLARAVLLVFPIWFFVIAFGCYQLMRVYSERPAGARQQHRPH